MNKHINENLESVHLAAKELSYIDIWFSEEL